jgi:hypothetical protein
MSGVRDVRRAARSALHSERVPAGVREGLISARDAMRRSTARWRVLPEFVIIGVHKGGTTSLYDYLAGHPQVVPAFEKEIHYFDSRWDGRVESYRASFPNAARMRFVERRHGQAVTGEASPYYISHPHVPRRVAELVPDARLILLLRNPVDRTISAFHHNRRRTLNEPLDSLAAAIDRELNELSDEQQRLIADEEYPDFEYAWHCYLARGVYVDQLRWWHECFPREQVLVLQSERLGEHPAEVFDEVRRFIGLAEWSPPVFARLNANTYDDVDPAVRRRLEEYFAPHNERLYAYLGERYDWS